MEVTQFTAPPPIPNNTSPAWTWRNYIQVFHLLVSVMVLASFVGSWFGFSFGIWFNKRVGSDKAIRRQSFVDWVQ